LGDDLRWLLRGAAVGAIVGGIGGLLYFRLLRPARLASGGAGRGGRELDRGKLMRLGWSVVGVVRQILSLG